MPIADAIIPAVAPLNPGTTQLASAVKLALGRRRRPRSQGCHWLGAVAVQPGQTAEVHPTWTAG